MLGLIKLYNLYKYLNILGCPQILAKVLKDFKTKFAYFSIIRKNVYIYLSSMIHNKVQ